MAVSTLFYEANCLLNNMKHIHFHAVGNLFDRLHSIAQEYYDKASEDADLFAEISIESGEKINNPSDCFNITGNKIDSEDEYSFVEGLSTIYQHLEYYISQLERERDNNRNSDIKSELDTIIRYWKKENYYKNVMRLKE